MILPLLLALQAGAGGHAPAGDPGRGAHAGHAARPELRAGRRPGGQRPTWGRRAAMLVFVLPSLTASTDSTGPRRRRSTSAPTACEHQRDGAPRRPLRALHRRRKFADYQRATAELEGAEASESAPVPRRAADRGHVLRRAGQNQELVAVAQRRLERAEEQLAASRARVVSGAAVQTDSLQLVLELTRPGWTSSGRRRGSTWRAPSWAAGSAGRGRWTRPVRHDGGAGAPARARAGGPDALAAGAGVPGGRAQERAAAATVRASGRRPTCPGSRCPAPSPVRRQVLPERRRPASGSLTVAAPDLGQRRAGDRAGPGQGGHDVAVAVRDDLERGALADVTAAMTRT